MKFNNESIRTAVKDWLENSKKAEGKYGHISDWDVSRVTDMSALFKFSESFNEDIGKWNVGNVKDMSKMFWDAKSFNHDIGSWDVSNVTKMDETFLWAKSFNQDIGKWDVSNVINMKNMFSSAESFNQDIGDWDVSNVTDMSYMFYYAFAFNKGIGGWNVSNVIDMKEMFSYTKSFNQDIGDWDVSNVTNMSSMFYYAFAFNKGIGGWNVSNVTDMSHMFSNAKSFNQDIGDWDVSNVTDMSSMFEEAKSFNQFIGNWNVRKLEIAYDNNILNLTGLSDLDTNSDIFILSKILPSEGEDEEISGYISVDIEGYTYTHGEYGEDGEFGAYELSIGLGGSWADGDGDLAILLKIREELNSDHIIITNVKNDNGENEYYRIVDLPEIFEAEFVNSHITIESNFTEDEDVINFVKNLKTISYKKINPNNEKEIELGYTKL